MYFRNIDEKQTTTYRNAFFGDDMKDNRHGFDYEFFMELYEFLIDNIYIHYGNYVKSDGEFKLWLMT